MLTAVRPTIKTTATSCWLERLTAYPPSRIGATRYTSAAMPGWNTPRNLANATETAAIVPVCTTRNIAQPNRKPKIGE